MYGFLDGCIESVPTGEWSCDRHAVEAWKRAQELIADREAAKRQRQGGAPASIRSVGRTGLPLRRKLRALGAGPDGAGPQPGDSCAKRG